MNYALHVIDDRSDHFVMLFVCLFRYYAAIELIKMITETFNSLSIFCRLDFVFLCLVCDLLSLCINRLFVERSMEKGMDEYSS